MLIGSRREEVSVGSGTFSSIVIKPKIRAKGIFGENGDAEIWFSGDKTTQTGSTRRFETPPLEPGSNYSYVVRARWTENGKERDETKKVAVHANDRVAVEFP